MLTISIFFFCLFLYFFFFFLMIRRPPRSTQAFTLFPYTTLFRSADEELVVLVLRLLDRAFELRDALLSGRSEEHTSELQSRTLISYAVFCLIKKKKGNEKRYNSFIKKNREEQQTHTQK